MVDVAETQTGIANSLFQLQALNQRLQTLTQVGRGVGPAIGKEAMGELGGILAKEIFGTARAGNVGYSLAKKLVAKGQAQQSATERMRIEFEFSQIVERALPILSQVSMERPSLKPPGNSHQIVLRLKRIAGFVKLETKVPRAIQFFQSLQQEKLLPNNDIPKVMITRRPGYAEAYELLRQLEESLRKLIEKTLSSISSDWWIERVPGDVKTNAEDRKQKNDRQWPWLTGTNLHPIYYVDFPDYVKIIRKKDNWHDVFVRVFKDEESISVKLREVEPIRNAVAHARPLPRNGLERLRINSKDILHLLAAG
jgi:hypothetical protein